MFHLRWVGLVFNKGNYGNLGMKLNLLVDGPTFKKYSPDFEKILKSDEFFKTRY